MTRQQLEALIQKKAEAFAIKQRDPWDKGDSKGNLREGYEAGAREWLEIGMAKNEVDSLGAIIGIIMVNKITTTDGLLSYLTAPYSNATNRLTELLGETK